MDFLHGAVALAVPLILAALGELISERAGVLNIGLEGLMLVGAFAAFAVTYATGSPGIGLTAAALFGMAFAALFALLTVSVKADQVIVGTGLNLIGLGLTGTIYRGLFSLSSAALSVTPLASVQWPLLGSIPVLGPLSVVAAAAVWWYLYRTRFGLALRACGEKPESADTAGYSVSRIRFLAVVTGGALTGVGGGYLSVAQGNTFVEGMTNGRGFIALALVIFGRWNPWGVLGAALFFGMAEQARYTLPGLGYDLSPQVIAMAPYLATLLALGVFRRRSGGPAALAVPYRRH